MRVHGFVAALGRAGAGARAAARLRQSAASSATGRSRTRSSTAYSVATIKERSPEVHLFIELPPDRVDVNVHPTKAEVRFLEQGLVHEVLRRAIVDALGAGPAPELRLQAPVATDRAAGDADAARRACAPTRVPAGAVAAGGSAGAHADDGQAGVDGAARTIGPRRAEHA